MTLFEILVGAGLVAGMVVTGLVYLDCTRRGLSTSSRIVWALACGSGSVAGFLVPYAFRQELLYLYYQVLKPRPIVVSPYESLLVSLTTGLVIAVVLVVLYLSGVRFQNSKAA
ncbi:hypothetical protein [Halobacterium bonnevillei]|uniref:Uncharacterized protein n=1 Tax=Halobacterium bonnevillei TaxID=2692200 RepID=A0A6B0SQ07_9EURY|nr:hypothetical protein [Halobacterium bonnevillei]MXR19719.1 hypothetical protein [Halobacterium bonnevillei]